MPEQNTTPHHPKDCPQGGYVFDIGCGCDGAIDDGCHLCTPERHAGFCADCDQSRPVVNTHRRTIRELVCR